MKKLFALFGIEIVKTDIIDGFTKVEDGVWINNDCI